MMYAIDPTMSFAQGLRETDEELRTQTGILPAICNRQILKSDDPVAKKPPAHPIFLLLRK